MRKFYLMGIAATILSLFIAHAIVAQDQKYPLGETKSFREKIRNEIRGTDKARAKPVLNMKVSATETLPLKINVTNTPDAETEYLIGQVQGIEGSSFFIRVDGKKMDGNIILKKQN